MPLGKSRWIGAQTYSSDLVLAVVVVVVAVLVGLGIAALMAQLGG